MQLPVLAHEDAQELLDTVTDVEGVVAALVDMDTAQLEIVVSGSASALHVREQLRALTHVSAA
jgi:hypothetical protein